MKYPAAIVLISFLLAAGGAPDKPVKEAPPTIPADTFLTGCELILFGKDVEPVTQNGLRGYRVAKDDSTVTINGIVYFSTKTPPLKRVTPIDPDIIRWSAVMEAAQERVDSCWSDVTGEVAIDGVVHVIGDTFAVHVPEYDTFVSVTVFDHELQLTYEEHKALYVRECCPNEPVFPVEVVYEEIVGNLSGPRFIIKGRGYGFTFSLSNAPGVRASLAKIPAQAEVLHTDEYGRNVYKPLTIDGYLWHSGIIRDIVEN